MPRRKGNLQYELTWIAFWDNNQAGIKVYIPRLSRIQRYVLTTDKVVSLRLTAEGLLPSPKGLFGGAPAHFK